MTVCAFILAGVLWFDETVEIRERVQFLGVGLLFSVGIVFLVGVCFYERKRIVRLLETANVVKYRVSKRIPKVKTILKPVGGAGEPLEVQSQVTIFPGETVHVFLDEAKPKQSLIAESLGCEPRFDPETGEIDCDPSLLTRYTKWSLAALALGIGLIVLRVILLW